MRERITSQDVEILVANHFGFRQNIVVPNVSWGMNLGHEADMIILRPSGYAIEIEIKVTAGDIKADTKKCWRRSRISGEVLPAHWCRMVKLVFFALPEKLKDNEHIPPHVGILSIVPQHEEKWYDGNQHLVAARVEVHREPRVNTEAVKWSDKDRAKLAELGCMRIWALKQHLANIRKHT